MSGLALFERWYLRQFGPAPAVPLYLPGRVLGRELRTHTGGTDPQTQHGGPRRHTSLLAHHSQ
jgi:hypothetical protein